MPDLLDDSGDQKLLRAIYEATHDAFRKRGVAQAQAKRMMDRMAGEMELWLDNFATAHDCKLHYIAECAAWMVLKADEKGKLHYAPLLQSQFRNYLKIKIQQFLVDENGGEFGADGWEGFDSEWLKMARG